MADWDGGTPAGRPGLPGGLPGGWSRPPRVRRRGAPDRRMEKRAYLLRRGSAAGKLGSGRGSMKAGLRGRPSEKMASWLTAAALRLAPALAPALGPLEELLGPRRDGRSGAEEAAAPVAPSTAGE